jgi:hypothetical protein
MTQSLNLKCALLVSKFALKCNLCRYIKVAFDTGDTSLDNLYRMVRWLTTGECRQKMLADHFGESRDDVRGLCECDVCRGRRAAAASGTGAGTGAAAAAVAAKVVVVAAAAAARDGGDAVDGNADDGGGVGATSSVVLLVDVDVTPAARSLLDALRDTKAKQPDKPTSMLQLAEAWWGSAG